MLKSASLPARIALVELASSHDECLLTQIHALKSVNCWVLLVTNEVVRERNQHLEQLVDEWILVDHRDERKRKGLTGAAIGDALIIRRLMRTLKRKDVDKVVFNTAQGGHVRNACLFSLFRKMEFIGIVHTTRKFQGSFTQRMIHLKIKKYFVLGEFLRDGVASTPLSHRDFVSITRSTADDRSRSHRNPNIQISYFYPIYFPKSNGKREVNQDQTHIALIGAVETRRKDLNGCLSLIKQCDDSVHFHFLGKADPQHSEIIHLKNQLKSTGRSKHVTFHDSFVDFDTIDEILRKSSAILPLIHPNTPSSEEYFRHQIPGAMSVALGYHLPLLMHETYQTIDELKTAAVYYTVHSFRNALVELHRREKDIRNAMKSHGVYSSQQQYERYLALVLQEDLSE